jgi:hypothetical protein
MNPAGGFAGAPGNVTGVMPSDLHDIAAGK